MTIDTIQLKDYFTGLQSRIVGELEAFDGQPFRTDSPGYARKAAAASRG
jgi:coproporphyrinogen III oxidase